jgi:hypothetical protein
LDKGNRVTIDAEHIKSFMAEHLEAFRPFAYFDKHMDCIRVLINDVSTTEVRLNEFFTVARANGSGINAGSNVGFTIKGVAYLFDEIGLPLKGVHDLVHILDEIVKTIPHTAVKRVLEEFSPALKQNHLSVSFDEEEALAA